MMIFLPSLEVHFRRPFVLTYTFVVAVLPVQRDPPFINAPPRPSPKWWGVVGFQNRPARGSERDR